MRVGVVSDIHGGYRELEKALDAMGPIDLLLHAGDGRRDLDRLLMERSLPCHRVVGNCDFGGDLPTELRLAIDRWSVYLTHGHHYGVKQGLMRLGLKAQEMGVDMVIFGHTHQPFHGDYHGVTLFNPGSLSPERCLGKPSYGLIVANERELKASIYFLR